MDEILLLDAVERYRNNEMGAEEKVFFEELRKSNAEVDQMVVEQMLFLDQLEHSVKITSFKQSLSAVEEKLLDDGSIEMAELKPQGKLVYLWNRYRRTVAVAASIAGIVSIFTAGVYSVYDKNNSAKITPLVDYKFKQVDAKLRQFESKLNSAAVNTAVLPPVSKPKFEGNFRATGFLIDVNGFIVTNAHVINNAKTLVVENTKGEQYYANAVYVNKTNDLAILKIIDTSFKKFAALPYSIRKGSGDLGEQIFTLGYPREEVVYGEGYLSAKSGYSGDTSSYQISISVNPGNSGGPVISKSGEVIGIISSKETNADGVVFAIKSRNIYKAIEEINLNDTVKLPSTTTLKGIDRVQQVKKMEDCVFMVKGN